MDRQIDRYVDRQIDKQIDRQIEIETDIEIETEIDIDRWMDGQIQRYRDIHKYIYIYIDTEIERQRDRSIDRQMQMQMQMQMYIQVQIPIIVINKGCEQLPIPCTWEELPTLLGRADKAEVPGFQPMTHGYFWDPMWKNLWKTNGFAGRIYKGWVNSTSKSQ